MDTENQELTESGINCRVGEWRQNWRPNRGRRKPISIERPKYLFLFRSGEWLVQERNELSKRHVSFVNYDKCPWLCFYEDKRKCLNVVVYIYIARGTGWRWRLTLNPSQGKIWHVALDERRLCLSSLFWLEWLLSFCGKNIKSRCSNNEKNLISVKKIYT